MAGKVVWYEILGQDDKKLREFYSGLFDWSFDFSMMDTYGMTKEEDTGVGGGIGFGEGGVNWAIFYVGVDDIDATIQKVKDSGGSMIVPKTDVPGGPTIAVFKDPEGNTVGLVQNM